MHQQVVPQILTEAIQVIQVHTFEQRVIGNTRRVQEDGKRVGPPLAVPITIEDAPPRQDKRVASLCCHDPILDILLALVHLDAPSRKIERAHVLWCLLGGNSAVHPTVEGLQTDSGNIDPHATILRQQRKPHRISLPRRIHRLPQARQLLGLQELEDRLAIQDVDVPSGVVHDPGLNTEAPEVADGWKALVPIRPSDPRR
mmetsp:Transcript_50880/g.131375  ORF Transcript_50880/g.131375 Transcript_50880/m.131375 type:complete len:200 (-) Transcript_50880:10-609(-)